VVLAGAEEVCECADVDLGQLGLVEDVLGEQVGGLTPAVRAGRLAIGVGVEMATGRDDETAMVEVVAMAMAVVLVTSWVHVVVGYGAAKMYGRRKRKKARKCMIGKLCYCKI